MGTLTLAGHRYVPRSEWGARNPTRELTPFALPARRLYVHHTGAEAHGPAAVRGIQRFHQDTRGWADIAYAYLIDDDGSIYEGRGHQFIGGATIGENATSHAICLMGNFQHRVPTMAAQASLVDMSRLGAGQGWWVPTMHGHRDSAQAQTACPGEWLYRMLPTIRHRVADIDNPAPAPTPPTPDLTEDPDMRIIDCPGKPALVLLGDGSSRPLNQAQRGALRSADIKAAQVTPEERAEILALFADNS